AHDALDERSVHVLGLLHIEPPPLVAARELERLASEHTERERATVPDDLEAVDVRGRSEVVIPLAARTRAEAELVADLLLHRRLERERGALARSLRADELGGAEQPIHQVEHVAAEVEEQPAPGVLRLLTPALR